MSEATRPLPFFLRVWKSTIGRKLLVATTGIILTLFLLGHLSGNMLVYAGPKAFNDYAYFLHHLLHGAGIWIARAVLLAAIVIHIAATVSLARQNRSARERYAYTDTIQASRSSLIMIWTGLTILVFVIYHLLHFTVRVGNEYNQSDRYFETVVRDGREIVRHDAWQMVIDGFSPSAWYVAVFYVIAISLLCSHLAHGVQSMFQTLGWRSRKTAPMLHKLSVGYAGLIWVGFISIPIAILIFGFGR